MLNKLFFLIFVILFTIVQIDARSRIIGGHPIKEKYAPYHVSLQNSEGTHVCGGAIICKHLVLSAAHCFVGIIPEYVFVVTGTIDLNKGGDHYNVSHIVSHENYSIDTKENDIAMVVTKTRIVFSEYVQSISFMSKFIREGDTLLFTGFGVTSTPGNASSILKGITLNTLNFEICRYAYRNIRKLFDSQLCTFNQIGQGACHGDSGSPLVYQSSLVGISSFGIPCALGFPDVFTRTASFLPWIKEVIDKYETSV